MTRLSVELIDTGDTDEHVGKSLANTGCKLVLKRTSVNGNPEFDVDCFDDVNALAFLDAVYGAGNHDGVDCHRIPSA